MSFMVKMRKVDEISNKDREDFLSPKGRDDYVFKYIPEAHFKYIVKNVQRERLRKDEERVWGTFVKEQELNGFGQRRNNVCSHVQSVKDLIRDSIQDVDRELKRLEEDALPEQTQRVHGTKVLYQNKRINLQVNNTRCGSPDIVPEWNKDETSDISLPIPNEEEENLPDCSSGKIAPRSNKKKSSSDPSIVRKERYSSQLLSAANDLGDDFNLELTTQRSNEQRESGYVRLDPLVTHRILSMQKRIGELLDEISLRLCRIPLPDGDTDFRRRQQRTMEFAIRFSRNYLYDLNRFLTSIRRHMSVVFPRAGLTQHRRTVAIHRETMEQKLIAAYQLLVQALTAYCKHIPTSILRAHPTKLKEVLQVVIELVDICEKMQIAPNDFGSGDACVLPLGNELQSKCNIVLSKLKLDSESRGRNQDSVEPSLSLVSSSSNKQRSGRKNLSNRLSMYHADVKVSKHDQRQRRSHPRQNGRKCAPLNSKVMIRERQIPFDLPHPSPVTHASTGRDIIQNRTQSSSYSKEDNIKTVMGTLPIDSENDSNVETQTKVDRVVTRQRPRTAKKISCEKFHPKSSGRKEKNERAEKSVDDEDLMKKVTTITKEHLSTLVPVIADLMTLVSQKQNELEIRPMSETSVESFMKYLQENQTAEEPDSKNSKSNGLREHRRCSKNMQLICVSSVENDDKDVPRCDVSCQVNYKNPIQSTDARISSFNAEGDEIEIIISEETERKFIKYQREYKKSCESKPMYCSNTQNKPWEVVSWISDKLVEELLAEVAKELQMNEVIQKLFELEFQDY